MRYAEADCRIGLSNCDIQEVEMKKDSLKIYLFCCLSNYHVSELEQYYSTTEDQIKIIPIPCSGKLDVLYLTKAFETGADGVAITMCKHDDCRFLEGNLRAAVRAEIVEELLEDIGLNKERVTIIQRNDDEWEHAIREFNDFHARIKAISGDRAGIGVTVAVY
jgi:F420-non-reducing hydrogenase iron-sulfur subunit